MPKPDFAIRLYDSMTRQKQVLQPIQPDHPRLYVCGPTVYDRIHIGNARPLVVFDVLYRLLRYRYGEANVTYVRNITDIDDKIIARAKEAGMDSETFAEKQIKRFREDCKTLGLLKPSKQPRAIKHIPHIVKLIESLIEKKHAYVTEGHVLFDVTSFADYGKLSRQNEDEMEAGARVEVAPYKKSPMDFVLWKPSTADQPGWESPWGRGRPGWHIECSAMAEAWLGVPFDIHGGGIDLIFPHHENEIAQSRCAHGCESLAQIWMHNGYLMADGKKMAKSVGNVLSLKDALEKVRKNYGTERSEVIRYILLSTHYRQPLDFKKAKLSEGESRLSKLYLAVDDTPFDKGVAPDAKFMQALADDLNTPSALTHLHDLADKAKRGVEGAREQLKRTANILGLLAYTRKEWFTNTSRGDKWIREEIKKYDKARKERDYDRADAIRDKLKKEGIIPETDRDGKTTYRRLKLHEMSEL